MQIRDRIRELRRVPAGQLRPNPKNWRTHPAGQRDALQGLLADLGYCDALLARELPGGALELIDGHLRAETTPEAEVPVLILDVNEEEADKLLLTLDPLAGLAQADAQALDALMQSVQVSNAAVADMLAKVAESSGLTPPGTETEKAPSLPPERFEVVVECRDEGQQKELFDRLTEEGLTCRVLTF